MIFVQWCDPNLGYLRGRVLGWAREGRMYAAVLVGDVGYEVALADMTFIEDVTKKQIRKKKHKKENP